MPDQPSVTATQMIPQPNIPAPQPLEVLIPEAVAVINQASQIKSGFRSSEYWFSTITAIATFAGGVLGYIPTKIAIPVSAAIAMAYSAIRGFIKVKALFAHKQGS